MYTVFRHIAGLKRRLTLPTLLPLLCLSRQSFHEIDTGRDDDNNGGGVVWGQFQDIIFISMWFTMFWQFAKQLITALTRITGTQYHINIVLD